MKSFFRKKSGFTLIEVVVAAFIFALSMVTISRATINFYVQNTRHILEDMLYEESRFLLDRIAIEVRNKAIDYDEYFNQLGGLDGGADATERATAGGGYGQFYREYYHNFFYIDPDEEDALCGELRVNNPARYAFDETDPCYPRHVNEGLFSTGADNDKSNDDPNYSALGGIAYTAGETLRDELYLISNDGKEKMIFKRETSEQGVTGVSILELKLRDQYDNALLETPATLDGDLGTPDGYYDCWGAKINFPPDELPKLHSFLRISPRDIEVTNLEFFITPIEDPRKAFSESDVSIQAQPTVTILITTEVSSSAAARFNAETPPAISLQTTVSPRIYSEVLIPFIVDEPNPNDGSYECMSPAGGGSGGDECPPADFCDTDPTASAAIYACCLNAGVSSTDCDNNYSKVCVDDSALGGSGKIVGGGHDCWAQGSAVGGSTGNDVLVGSSSVETIGGSQGDDIVCGGTGDSVAGNNGTDYCFGDTIHSSCELP